MGYIFLSDDLGLARLLQYRLQENKISNGKRMVVDLPDDRPRQLLLVRQGLGAIDVVDKNCQDGRRQQGMGDIRTAGSDAIDQSPGNRGGQVAGTAALCRAVAAASAIQVLAADRGTDRPAVFCAA